MVASSTTITLGLSRVYRRLFAVVMGMSGVIPGVLAPVTLRCVRGFVAMTYGLVGLVVVVTDGANVATLYSVATPLFVWLVTLHGHTIWWLQIHLDCCQ